MKIIIIPNFVTKLSLLRSYTTEKEKETQKSQNRS